jgi:hypothetical protein
VLNSVKATSRKSLLFGALLASIASSAASAAEPQKTMTTRPLEQAEFGMESDHVAHPVGIPKDVVQTVQTDKWVQTCLEKGQSPNEIPPSWFVASRIHLNGQHEVGLVVMPENGCLLGANTAPFWIFRKTTKGHQLILDISVHDLRFLESKTHGLRDIETSSSTAVERTVLLFKFDGQIYQLSERRTDQ